MQEMAQYLAFTLHAAFGGFRNQQITVFHKQMAERRNQPLQHQRIIRLQQQSDRPALPGNQSARQIVRHITEFLRRRENLLPGLFADADCGFLARIERRVDRDPGNAGMLRQHRHSHLPPRRGDRLFEFHVFTYIVRAISLFQKRHKPAFSPVIARAIYSMNQTAPKVKSKYKKFFKKTAMFRKRRQNNRKSVIRARNIGFVACHFRCIRV